jgi:acetylornithine deacetylase/succinyl-diaminopimelate desuccinylase-like protein
MRLALVALLVASLLAGAAVLVGQSRDSQGRRDHPRLQSAVDFIRAAEPATIAAQVRLCEVPAPTFGERARAEVVRELFDAAGLKNVRRDREGNVVGEWPGRSTRPHLVLAAHLDTVFPEGTPVTVRRAGSLFRGPGIGDNCRGLAVLVAVARALSGAGLKSDGPITFAATVAEEGLGNLRGVRALLTTTLKGGVDHFVAVDGSGTSITNVGVGSRRYRVTFRGSGGHSYNNFGRANPAQALGRAMALISDLRVPSTPKTTFSVGRIGGGTSINAIPTEAWMELDLRSIDARALDALDRSIQDRVKRAVALENDRWNRQGQVTVALERVGDRPAGRTDEKSAVVQAALVASRRAGMEASLVEGSTDANAPMQLNIPSIAIGGGGRGTGGHTVDETFDSATSVRGSERALLLAVALSSR